ncbi:hypothetical protein AADW59_00615 [Candidatus Hodgkinia cicadicola]
MFTTHAVSHSLILNLKRDLHKHSASVKHYRNASFKLAFKASFPIFSSITGQHALLAVERDELAVCKLVAAFIKLSGARVFAFVWNKALCDSKCIGLVACSSSEASLRAGVLLALKSVLSRFAIVLSLPLLNFVNLMNQGSTRNV